MNGNQQTPPFKNEVNSVDLGGLKRRKVRKLFEHNNGSGLKEYSSTINIGGSEFHK